MRGRTTIVLQFLARAWESDRKVLDKQLARLGADAHEKSDPLTLLICELASIPTCRRTDGSASVPEGTLVSKDTRPLSKKYADKTGLVRCPSSTIVIR